MNKIVIIAAAFLLTGCARAVIADLEEDKVIVQATGDDQEMIMNEARRGCGIHNREPVPISKRCVDQYCTTANYLFACKKKS